jgi:hypothetical protein
VVGEGRGDELPERDIVRDAEELGSANELGVDSSDDGGVLLGRLGRQRGNHDLMLQSTVERVSDDGPQAPVVALREALDFDVYGRRDSWRDSTKGCSHRIRSTGGAVVDVEDAAIVGPAESMGRAKAGRA